MEREYWEDKNKSGEDLICLLVDYFETPLLRSEFQKANVLGNASILKFMQKHTVNMRTRKIWESIINLHESQF